MSQYSSYYLYQKYEKRGSQDWIPCYPNVYSISGDSSNPMTLVMKEENDPQCGYAPPSEPQYRWNVVDGFLCANCDTTKAMIHTSADTIYISGSGEITQAEVSGYASAATDVVITTDARAIGNNAFSGFSGVEFVRIPNSVTSIGEKSFYGCDVMTECQIPYGVLNIGNSAFTNSMSLMFVDIPNSVTSLGNGCFKNCANFRYASIPSSISNIPSECFYNCDGLSDIEIPSSVSGIGDSAFAQCSGLYSVTFNSTTPPTLGASAFTNTSSNLKIYVPCGYVGAYKAASGWSEYASKIVVNDCGEPTGATRFYAEYSNGMNYFEYCNSDSAITSASTSYETTNMITAVVGDCITSIGGRAFKGCTNLTSVTIPNTVTKFGTIEINGNSSTLYGGSFYDCDKLSRMNSNIEGEINIPSSVISIFGQAFMFCSSIRSVNLPSGLTEVSSQCFRDCTSLSSVTFADNCVAQSIDFQAFCYCKSLTNITLPYNIRYIRDSAFAYSSGLTSVIIQDKVTKIEERAFGDCSGLTSVTIYATTPPTLGTNVFSNTNANLKIYVPSSSVDTYKAASGWSTYANKINPIE